MSIVIIDSRADEPKDVFVFDESERAEAEKQFWTCIEINEVHIEDDNQRICILEDGLCQTAVGYVALMWA